MTDPVEEQSDITVVGDTPTDPPGDQPGISPNGENNQRSVANGTDKVTTPETSTGEPQQQAHSSGNMNKKTSDDTGDKPPPTVTSSDPPAATPTVTPRHPTAPTATEIPSQKALRNMKRSAEKSHKAFMELLVITDKSFLNSENRQSSAVQASMNQALGDNEQLIRMIETRLKHCPGDKKDDIELNQRYLSNAKAMIGAMTKAYADRIEELTLQHDDTRSVRLSQQQQRHQQDKVSNAKTKSSRSSRSKRQRAAEIRLEEIRLEKEYEDKLLKEKQEHEKRELARKKEELKLQAELESSEDSSNTVQTVNTHLSRRKKKSNLSPEAAPFNTPVVKTSTPAQHQTPAVTNTAPPDTSAIPGDAHLQVQLESVNPVTQNQVGNNSITTNDVAPGAGIIDKLLHLKVMERREISSKFDGNPVHYISFLNEFKRLMCKFSSDRHYLFTELLSSLTGKALDAVSHCRDLPCSDDVNSTTDALAKALQVLKRNYGSDYQVREALLNPLRDKEKKNEIRWNQDCFRQLLSDLEKASTLLSSPAQRVHLDQPDLISDIVERLPRRSQNSFMSWCAQLEDPSNPGFALLTKFVESELRLTSMSFARLVTQKVPAKKSPQNKPPAWAKKHDYPYRHHTAGAHSAGAPTHKRRDPPACHYCKKSHRLQDCKKFLDLTVPKRWEFIKKAGNICEACFGKHKISDCKSEFCCRTCKKFDHHTKLCKEVDSNRAAATTSVSEVSSEVDGVLTSTVNSTCASIYPVYVRVVALRAFNADGVSVPIYALLDSGSSITLCSEQVASKLKLTGRSCSLTLQGVNSKQELSSKIVSFDIKGVHKDAKSFKLKSVTCIASLPGHASSIPASAVTARHEHLQDIAFPSVSADKIDLLIGADNEILHEVLECRSSETSELRGYLTPLGWVIAGTDNQTSTPVSTLASSTYLSSTSNRALHANYGVDISDHVLETVSDMMLHCKDGTLDENLAPSVEDEAVLDLFINSRTKSDDGHFILPIPFRDKEVNIPNNRSCAEARLRSLTVNLRKDGDLKEFYTDKMQDMQTKIYMREVPTAPRNQPNVVYLYHFPTRQTKRRIVLDAAASDTGPSFNSRIMQGPDMMQPLVDVILRFRQDDIGFMCDIKEMFHQVRLPADNKVSLRILWYKDHDIDKPLQDYEITVHPFGLKSSPAAANFCIRQTALDNESDASAETVNVMLKQLYVDDCLNSEENADTAIRRIKELNELAATSGFEFVKYTSNSREVLNSLPSDLLIPDLRMINLRQDGLPTQKALGVYWDPTADTFTFRIHIQDKPRSKRGMLSMLCRVFDPLGMALPYLMTGRRIMQDAFSCTQSGDWDKPLPSNICKKWDSWLEHLPLLENIAVPRCYHVTGGRPDHYELHTFADASNVGVSAVSFIRYHKEGTWCCSFVRGKGHVIPRDTSWSTARYELEAAVLAALLHSEVGKALDLPIKRCVLWTDSATVLTWLNNTSRRPKVFVYNRRKEILRHTDSSHWRYINTLLNPADLATRGLPSSKISSDCLWLTGPDFLRLPDEEWPVWILPGVNDSDLELLTAKVCNSVDSIAGESIEEPTANVSSTAVSNISPAEKISLLLWKYSSLSMLLKVVAWLKRLSSKSKTPNLSCDELDQALVTSVKLAQREYFSPHVVDKIKSLGFNEALSRISDKKMKELLIPIQKLSPFVDDHGLLRVGGRLQNSALPVEMIHPIILPRRHHVTRLIIEDHHYKNRHFGGVSYVMNLLSSRFWVNHSTVKFYLDRCLMCVRIRAKTGIQIMAPLPAVRVATGGQPFSATGVDYMGPLLVQVKRSKMKRWVALFTCLATRAVHIEKVHTLETSSFLQAFIRFRCARNGSVKKLYSDNASTFHGADNELRQALIRLEEDGFREKLQACGVDWHFNPPLASHQGGVWERQIRSIRKVLLGLPAFERTTPNDEMLDTILKDAECIINNRPLTAIDGDPESVPALTPGMLLIGSLAPATPLDLVHDSETLKRNWRYTQVAADQFWSRFVKEYIRNLQPRLKWYTAQPNFKLGDVVLVKEERSNYRPNYPKARITNLNIGPDGHVRSVELRFPDGRRLVRDIRKVVPLQCIDEQE